MLPPSERHRVAVLRGPGVNTGTESRPWYERTTRWAQTNLTERDPSVYDAELWRAQWRRTKVQGVIVNAGGIVAYYPSRFPLHHRAVFLDDRDLYGEIVELARKDGLAVLARMDSNRASEDMFVAHPEWFARQADGEPYVVDGRYIACLNSGYYEDFLADVLREIIERSHPDGITDNSWSGLSRHQICYCEHCRSEFAKSEHLDLPKSPSWETIAYRRWVEWSYRLRLKLWDFNSSVTSGAGGPECLWIGMNSGDPLRQAEHLRDLRAICQRTRIFMLDFQTRPAHRGPHNNREAGSLLHELLGWERLIPESMAMYSAGQPTFRLASKTTAEVRLWAFEGMAGGISPWWHHIGSAHDDKRQYDTSPPIFSWHKHNQDVLYERQPLANVGIVWSQRNIDFYGRDHAEELIAEPYWGVANALLTSRLPFLPIHADDVPDNCSRLKVLWLPNVGALSAEQCARLRSFAASGGSIIASGETSLYDEWGEKRTDFELADLFGVHSHRRHEGSVGLRDASWETWDRHTYLRLHRRAGSAALFTSLDSTEILPFGGRLEVVDTGSDNPMATWVPPFPMYPPEASWMREADSGMPAIVTRTLDSGGRFAYLAADIDRCFGRDRTPDCGTLLANLTRWAVADDLVIDVAGTGLIDVQSYRQGARYIVHLVNLNHPGLWGPPIAELTAVGPFVVQLPIAGHCAAEHVELRVHGASVPATREGRWLRFEVQTLVDHEVAVIG